MSIFGDDVKSTIAKPLVVFFLVLLIILTFWESFDKWKEHPQKLVCSKQANLCTLTTYSYEHKICWGAILGSRHGTSRCRLPKHQTSRLELFPLMDIEGVGIQNKSGRYVLYIKNKAGQTIDIGTEIKETDAIRVSGLWNAQIKKWQDEILTGEEIRKGDFILEFIYWDK